MVPSFQLMMETLSRLYIFTRIGDKYVEHHQLSFDLKLLNLLRHSTTIAVLGERGGLADSNRL